MKLIGSLTSPYVRKVRVVLAEKKLEYELIQEDVWASDAVQRFNPLGKVPCLVMEGGEAVFDSRVIVEYLDTLSPVAKLIPDRGRERAEVKTWEALCDGVMDAVVAIRLESHWSGRTPEQRSALWMERQRGKVVSALSAMEAGLEGRLWCHGNHLTLADLCVGVTLAYVDFRLPDLSWRADHPLLDRMYLKLASRSSFMDTEPPKV